MKSQTSIRLRALLVGVACVVAAPVVAAPSLAVAEVPAVKRIAMVDMQKVLNETKSGKAARAKLEESSKLKQAKIDRNRNKLEAEAQKLSSLKGAALAAAQEKLQQDSMDLQSMMMTLEQELGEQHNTMLEAMYGNAQKIVASIAKDRGIDLVLVRDAMTVIYAKDGLDITDEVVKIYNTKHPS